MKPVRGLIYFGALYCTFIFADWKASLQLLERAKISAGLEEINEIQNYIWNLKDSDEKTKLISALEEYAAGAPVVGVFSKAGNFGVGPAKKEFFQLEGGLQIIFKFQYDEKFTASTMEKEVLAYQLNKLWNLDIVPVTIEKEIKGVRGSAQVWIPFYQLGSNFIDDLNSVRKYFWMKAFDYIVNEQDRHNGNYLVGNQIAAIDNSYLLEPWGQRKQIAPVFIPNEIKGDWELFYHLTKSGVQDIEHLLKRKVPKITRQQVQSRYYEVLRFISGSETRAQIHAYPARVWEYSKVPQRVVIKLKKIKTQNGIQLEAHAGESSVLTKISDGKTIQFYLPQKPKARLRGLKFSYASRTGVQIVLREAKEDKLILAQHLLAPTGGPDIWKHVILPTATLVNLDEELELEFFHPSRSINVDSAYVSFIELEFELEAPPLEANSRYKLDPEQSVGSELEIEENKYRVLERVGHGGFGVVYKVENSDGEVLALKIARSQGANKVIRMDEAQRFELLRELPKLKVPKYKFIGENFVLKDFYNGISANSFLEQFNLENTQDVGAIIKLLEVFKYLAQHGIFAPSHNLNNWLWDGQDWVIIDSSDRMEMGLYEFQALLKYRKNFEEIWILKNPLLKGFSPIWIKILNSPVYNINIGDCGRELI